MKKSTERVEILDGMRVLAIVLVMLFHYYSRFAPRHYSYTIQVPEIFKLGHLGVQLFFVISGFVIFHTLTKCSNFIVFMKKRFLRLIPGMAICSLLTFLFLNFADTNHLFMNGVSLGNLFVSNLFIPPHYINTIFGTNLYYIDGVYWSLACELQFYVLAGLIYFASPKNFLRNYVIFALLSSFGFVLINAKLGYDLFSPVVGSAVYLKIRSLNGDLLVFQHNLWFLIGIIVNKLYFQKHRQYLLLLLFAIFGLQVLLLNTLYPVLFAACVLFLFILFIYKPHVLGFLANKTLAKIGVASYSIYLVHQEIGVVILNRISPYFGALNWLIPVLLMGLFFLFGVISYRYLEQPLGRQLKKLVFKSKDKQVLPVQKREPAKAM